MTTYNLYTIYDYAYLTRVMCALFAIFYNRLPPHAHTAQNIMYKLANAMHYARILYWMLYIYIYRVCVCMCIIYIYVRGRCVKTLVGVVMDVRGGCGKREQHTKWWPPWVKWKRNEHVYIYRYITRVYRVI